MKRDFFNFSGKRREKRLENRVLFCDIMTGCQSLSVVILRCRSVTMAFVHVINLSKLRINRRSGTHIYYIIKLYHYEDQNNQTIRD